MLQGLPGSTLQLMNPRESGRLLWICLGLGLIPLMGWWLTGLFDLDEGFYAAIVGEMLRRGEWITPYYNGEPWFEKPILLYWVTMPSVLAFGEWVGPRLPSVLASLGLYAVVFRAARAQWGDSAAVWSVGVLSTSLLMVGLGRMMMTDALFALSLAGAFLLWYRQANPLLSGLAVGLAVLAKGPAGIVLFGGVILIYAALESSARRGLVGRILLGLVGMAAAVSLWYVPCYLANRDTFVQEFLIKQNWQRFLGGDQAHGVPLWAHPIYFPLILLVGMFPWSVAGVRALRAGWQGDPFSRFLVIWFGVIFLFFTVSGSKLPHYILPAVPALALLIGRELSQRTVWKGRARGEEPSFGVGPFAIAAPVVCLIANLVFWAHYHGKFGADSHAEVHRAAILAREAGGPVATYQLSRRSADLGTGQLKIQETSHPSFIFYLRSTTVDAESPEDLRSMSRPFWIFTRPDRVASLEPLKAEGWTLVPQVLPGTKGDYVLLKVR